MWMEKMFMRASRNRYCVGAVLCLLLSLVICCVVLSIKQAYARNDAYDVSLMGGFLSGWNTYVCRNIIVQFLSPFMFRMRIHQYDQDLGILGCPWRERNSILRLSFLTLSLVCVIWQLIVLLTPNGRNFWPLLHWFQFLMFTLFCTIFVLDCDGIYSGYNACINNFDVGGFGPIVLSLIGASFTTTLPPYFYSNPFFIPYQNQDSDTVVVEDFAITDGCLLTPFIYTLFNDLGLILFTYLVYRMTKIYDFGASKDEDDEYDEDEMEEDGLDCEQKHGEQDEEEDAGCFGKIRTAKSSREKARSHSTLKATRTRTATRAKKESMADYDHNRQTHQMSPAFPTGKGHTWDNFANTPNWGHLDHAEEEEVEVMPTLQEQPEYGTSPEIRPADPRYEPADWQPRKPTYDEDGFFD